MSVFRAFRPLCVMTASALAFSANAAPPTTVEWADDFLGLKIDTKYSQSLSGTGKIDLATFTGGAARIYTLSTGVGNARLRLGEDPGTNLFDVRNWNPSNTILFEARLFFNQNTDMQATVGFVGPNDPDNVLVAILDTQVNPQWIFQAQAKIGTTQYAVSVPTGFLHPPSQWIEFKITTSGGANSMAPLYINDNLVASAQSPQVPSTDLCPEFQIWNRAISGGWSQPTMWLDWFHVQQNR